MKARAILFDLDGTLVDTIPAYEEAVLASMQQVGLPITREKFLADYHAGKHLPDWLSDFGKTLEDVPQLPSMRDSMYEKLLEKIGWIEGAEEALTFAKHHGPVGIVTGSWKSYVDALDRSLHVTRFTNTIITAEDMGMGRLMKPHPHGLLIAADHLGIPPEACVYIGDQGFDLEASKRAGMPCILFRGPHTPPQLHGGNFEIRKLDEIQTIIG